MRYINLNSTLATIPKSKLARLSRQKVALRKKTSKQQTSAISRGNAHWRPIKQYLEAASARKCWYTESKNPGCRYEVEHFRPKGKVVDKSGNLLYWYWFLAFDPTNYRLSAQFPHTVNINPHTGRAAGKGTAFPLLPGCVRAINKAGLRNERPVLLDPCLEADTKLIEFYPDGRLVISRAFAHDTIASQRVEESTLLLNLNFATFNEGREDLYNRIHELVLRGDRYITDGIDALDDVKNDLKALLRPDAEYSKAAECYIRCFRDREWVEDLIL